MIQRVLPLEKKLNALEEAEFEDDGGEEGALDREMLSQGMDCLQGSLSFNSLFFPLNSDGKVTSLQTPGDHLWTSRNGSGLYWCRRLTSFGGLPRAKS